MLVAVREGRLQPKDEGERVLDGSCLSSSYQHAFGAWHWSLNPYHWNS